MANNKAPSRREALDAIFSHWSPLPQKELVDVSDAISRIAAQDIFAVHNLPVVRASAVDGIGVASAMFQNGLPDTAGWEPGRDFVRADTGDDFDDRFDTVIPIEAVTLQPEGGIVITPGTPVTSGMNVRPAGNSVKKGDLIVRAGTRLRPFDLGALIAGSILEVEVIKKPVVAFIPTGSELVAPGTAPARGQNIDSNSLMARYMLEEMGAAPHCFPIVHDDPAALCASLETAARKADIVLICGGSSKGGEDFTAQIITEMGEVILHWIAAAPGRPMCAAILDNKLLLNVPGPPPAAYFVLDWCVSALVARFLGVEPPVRKTVYAKLTAAIEATPGMEILRRLDLRKSTDGYEAIPLNRRCGSMITALTAPAQFVTDGGMVARESGEVIEVELLR